ncbi:acyltransferase [Clostridium sp.]|uniref:acyltransferase n=1 Tax=Clostridium sp. TaxID=1506 RepID=UPI001B58CDE2|nr:acyltransferase [Clostridium sp.]MBP3917181.1 acyltransferase [Clostridium sp.]
MKKASGREKFAKMKKVIEINVFILKLFPKCALKILWNIINGWHGNVGLLLRYCIAKVLFKACGDNVYIAPYVIIKNFHNIELGDNVSIHQFCYIDAHESIVIGNNVSVAHGSSIIDFEHTWDDKSMPIKYNNLITKQIKIEDDVWIGCGCRILAGVTLKSRSVIAAGAVVNKNVGSSTVVGGVPAKIIKFI